jgi:hypothetical protein
MAKALRSRRTLTTNVGREHGADPLPLDAHNLITNIMPHSNSKSCAFRKDDGSRMCIITTSRTTSDGVSKNED